MIHGSNISLSWVHNPWVGGAACPLLLLLLLYYSKYLYIIVFMAAWFILSIVLLLTTAYGIFLSIGQSMAIGRYLSKHARTKRTDILVSQIIQSHFSTILFFQQIFYYILHYYALLFHRQIRGDGEEYCL